MKHPFPTPTPASAATANAPAFPRHSPLHRPAARHAANAWATFAIICATTAFGLATAHAEEAATAANAVTAPPGEVIPAPAPVAAPPTAPAAPTTERTEAQRAARARLAWADTYYLNPDIALIPGYIADVQAAGLLLDGDLMYPLAAFMSCIYAANPTHIAAWTTPVANFSEAEKLVHIMALAWADVPEADAVLTAWGKGQGNFSQISLMAMNKTAPDFKNLTQPTAKDLGGALGAFMATGDTAYVDTLLRYVTAPTGEGEASESKVNAVVLLVNICQKHPLAAKAKDAFFATATPDQQAILGVLFPKAGEAMTPDQVAILRKLFPPAKAVDAPSATTPTDGPATTPAVAPVVAPQATGE